MIFTLLHPSRGRPQKARETYTQWMQSASGKHRVQHILSLDNDDPYAKSYTCSDQLISEDNTCVVEATNKAARIASGDVLIYMSDDFRAPKDWDLEILSAVNRLHAREDFIWLLKVDDCLQRFEVPVLTIPIMSRELYKRLGYFWHPEYRSMFVDEDLYWVTRNNGWLLEAPELKFPHEHCSIGKAERDETYIRSEKNWDQGKSKFAERKAAGFPV